MGGWGEDRVNVNKYIFNKSADVKILQEAKQRDETKREWKLIFEFCLFQ